MGKYAIRRLVLKASSRLQKKREESHYAELPDVLFIWIPKTAGTSIFTVLQELGMGKYKSMDRAKHLFPGSGMATFVHQSVPNLVDAGIISPLFVNNSFKFSFLRNPYDRAVSLYYYFRRFQRIPKEMGFEKFLQILETEWHKHKDLKPPAADELSDRLCYRGELVTPGTHTLYPVGLYNVLEWSQCRPQTDWLKGVADLDHIHLGRMENIDEDCKTIIRKIFALSGKDHLKAEEIYSRSVPKANITPHKDYREHYKDPALARIVELIYQEDFENFSY